MLKAAGDNERMKDKVELTLRVSFYASLLSLFFGCICLFLLHITIVVPYVFFFFAIVNIINIRAYKNHRNLTLAYNIISITGLACAMVITMYTEGINSAFIFVMAVVVFAGYVSTQRYGRIYLYITILMVVLIYVQGISNFSLTRNVVPPESQRLFSFLSVLFSIYILGGVLGKNLLKAHHNLYKSKKEIEERIKEKETLLREVHHRVKNNLQTVSSLLNLQSRTLDDDQVKDLIRSSQNRVISMAMVHEMLYMRDDLSKIEYRSYVRELSDYLVKSLKGTDHQIQLLIDIPDISLGIDTAIPLGLLINEAITNSLKYGILNDESGVISIKLIREDDNNLVLLIGDDGRGFPDTINYKTTKSLGLKLIHNLTRQLNGTISKDLIKKGTHYIIRFREVSEQDYFHTVP